MAKFKVRRVALLGGGVQIGTSGTSITSILAGSTSACVPAVAASTTGTGSIAISGVDAADNVFVFPAAGASGIAVINAAAISGGASLSFFNMGSVNFSASTVSFRYLVLGA